MAGMMGGPNAPVALGQVGLPPGAPGGPGGPGFNPNFNPNNPFMGNNVNA